MAPPLGTSNSAIASNAVSSRRDQSSRTDESATPFLTPNVRSRSDHLSPGWVASELAPDLRRLVAELAAGLVRLPGVRLVDAQRLDGLSPPGTRLDVRSYLTLGFPYRRAHAAALAELLVRLLAPPAPKKALITDLDDTLWRGVLGESTGVSWDLDQKSHGHALYQQLLAALAEGTKGDVPATRVKSRLLEFVANVGAGS